jgi:hypothetical protein
MRVFGSAAPTFSTNTGHPAESPTSDPPECGAEMLLVC